MSRSRSTGSTSPRRASWRLALGGRRRTPATISFAGPGKRDAELDAAIAAGVTLNLESEGEAERALAIGARLGRDAAARGPGQSRFRDQGLGHAHGRRRQAVRGRCRAGAGAGPADHRRRRRMARLPHLRRLAGARRRRPDRGAAGDARAGRRAGRGGRRARRRWSISAAASASPISTASSRSTSRRSARRWPRRWRRGRAILADTQLRDRARPLAGRRGGRLSDPDRRPQGEPRQDLPGHRRRHAPPARRLGQFRPGRPPQLSGRHRQPLRRAGRGGGRASSAACARRSTGSPTTS